MNRTTRQTETLVDEKLALGLYFEALLREPEIDIPAVDSQAPEPCEAPQPAAAPVDNIPAWGQSTFQAMLFKVAGLTLAVPLAELSGVQEWHRERVTPMPGHVVWYLGLMEYRGHSVPVVDTALLVLPEDRLARLSAAPESRLRRIVFIGDGEWGLACDAVTQVVTLTPDKVRWRTRRTRRRWLAGTVIDQMCAIIDPSAFAAMLATGIADAADNER